MAICLKIKGSSDSFVEAINVAIQSNDILTWAVDVEGDYTSSVLQWQEKAWFRPIEDSFSEFNLSFGIIKARNIELTCSLYAIYHARLVEMLLAHFDDKIEDLKITPLLTKGIDVF